MMRRLVDNKGITLVSLAVTMIIITILAGITVQSVIGENGLITASREIENNTIQAEIEAQTTINALKGEEKYLEDGTVVLKDETAPTINSVKITDKFNSLNNNSLTISVSVTETQTGIAKIEYSIDDGATYVTPLYNREKTYVFENLKSNTEYNVKVRITDEAGNEIIASKTVTTTSIASILPSTDYTTPYLPSTDFSQVEGTDLDTGLVIQDNLGNQYVWIEVPKTSTVYPTAGITLDLDTLAETELETAYSNIETDLHTYTSTYRGSTGFSDTYSADSNTGWFANETAYNEAKNNMLKSVYQNGGFYIGRYETGIEGSFRDYGTDYYTLHEATETPVIKANAYPYNWVRRTQAQVLASNMNSGNYTSSLMFGVQWDLVIAYMHNKGGIEDSTLTSNSTTIGNYNNNLWNMTNTTARYSTDNGASWTLCPYEKTALASVLLTTGADTSFEIMNIYDIAGNVWEWTLEKTSDTRYPCAGRGGRYNDFGASSPASLRGYGNTTDSISSIGFRVALY